ncbi:DUF4288 domain-containing protein [Micromonospora sp. MED01]|uniref:DUF4288 domain-containing protein n=1 Tax=Micromonospora alfalfae TaxID=2911212 RepID=UPI001EE892E0|nr:DUF4288 domain-containing protein [Micromonospora alfalfae]MCG5461591.1 DUF4288 domain-containing protein [Micromonospora alfalfae]
MDRPSGEAQLSEVGWFSVRCVFRVGSDPRGQSYEEWLTLWRAESFDQAIELAEAEALGYAADRTDTIFAGLTQAYRMFDAPRHGAEIFSLIRDSELNPQAYLTAYFDTGQERQGDVWAVSDEGCRP